MEGAAVWEEIERSESYLVCSMYEEAATLASSILKRIFDDIDVIFKDTVDDNELLDVLESAGMVLVQSLHGLGRTVEILNELRDVFTTVAAIPVQVLLTGVCFQISNSSCSGVREILEEFLSKWVCGDGHYFLNNDEAKSFFKGCYGNKHLDIDEYMEVAELYTLTFLGTISKDVNLAISWVEKAALPEERRQGLLRRLHSLFSPKTTNSSQGFSSARAKPEACSFMEDQVASKESSDAVYDRCLPNGKNDDACTVLKLSKQEKPAFWSSCPLSIKLGKVRLAVSNGKVVISLVIFIICYALRRKRAALMRFLSRQMLSVKKALVDFWRLAFSYQVNPLAAVQPLPGATRGS